MIRGESWTKPENIKAALSLAGQAGGGPVLYCENNRCWVHAGESNGIFLGVTGAGKSFCGTQNLVRSLIEAQESFLAVDPKGELYRRNACRMSKDYTVHSKPCATRWPLSFSVWRCKAMLPARTAQKPLRLSAPYGPLWPSAAPAGPCWFTGPVAQPFRCGCPPSSVP